MRAAIADGPVIVRNADLEPTWTVKQAKEPGFMRSLITWAGGPDGCINTNPDVAVPTERCVTGLMRMPVGNRQAGVHVHSVTEVYVILKGEVESFDGMGNRHRAGPLDCLYIPAGVPHGVRTVGDEDLELVWVHDAPEKWGVSEYLDGAGPFPADDEVRLVPFVDLQPAWSRPEAKVAGHIRWVANWVAGPDGARNHSAGVAVTNPRMALGLTVLLPGQAHVPHSHGDAETYVVLRGAAVARIDGRHERLGPLDALYCPANVEHGVRNIGDVPLYLLWVHDAPQGA